MRALAAGALVLFVTAAPGVEVARTAVVMGTTLEARVEAPNPESGMQAIERAFGAVRRVDQLLSTWRDDSEIARVNSAPPGVAVAMSPELAALLGEAHRWAGLTGRAFDPTVGALMSAWDLRGAGRIPDAATLRGAIGATGDGAFAIRGDVIERRAAAAWMDTGAFGKGAALRAAWAALDSAGIRSAFLNFGGQVLAIGRAADGGPWRVPVAHPVLRDSAVLSLSLIDRSASTTAQSERSISVGGRKLGHVIDPRSGEPVRAWGSVTVIARDAAVADILSTALFVMGPDAGLRWAEEHGAVAALFLIDTPNGVMVRGTKAARPYLSNSAITDWRS